MHRSTTAIVLASATALALSSCTLAAEKKDEKDEAAKPGSTVVLVTHDSFALPKRLIRKFEKDTGLKLKVRKAGDAGEVTTKLILTKSNPIGDVAFGVDNTFASRALDEGVFDDYQAELPPGADDLALDDDDSDHLTPVDQGSVCVNIDKTWFAEHEVTPPATLDDLTEPAYKDLFVTESATSSSPGMAFLLATMGAYGEDGWQDYWSRLMDNGAKLTSGWEDAYFVDFTAASDKGSRPIVVSYDTSPAFTIDKKTGDTTTAALLDTCFRQVEYAGVLDHAKNPAGAKLLVDFLVSDEVQKALPTSMYVFPVNDEIALPADWAKFAIQPETPYAVDPGEIAEHREDWLTEWRDIASR